MWCAYPSCFRGASAHCVSCGQQYCSVHCADWVYRAGDLLPECDLCQRHLSIEQVREAHPPGIFRCVGAITLFLGAIALSVLIETNAKGSGVVTVGVFLIAFIAFGTCVQH